MAASVSGTIAVETAPSAIAVDSTADTVYVADLGTLSATSCAFSGAGVTVINGATGTTAAVSLDVGPIAIASVDLPQPDSPTSPKLSPAFIANERLEIAGTMPEAVLYST